MQTKKEKKWEKRAPIRCSLWCFHAKLFCSSVAFCLASDLITAWCFQPLFWVISKKLLLMLCCCTTQTPPQLWMLHIHSWESTCGFIFVWNVPSLLHLSFLKCEFCTKTFSISFLIWRVETATLAASDVQKRDPEHFTVADSTMRV